MLGFQARRLHDDDPLKAKYVNTAESELFTKGAVLYGLDKARASISREGRACIVEGNTDVIALRQAGFQPVVACMGTALTEDQLRELGRLDEAPGARVRRRSRRRVGGAARDGAGRPAAASTSRSSRSQPGSTRPTIQPASRASSPRRCPTRSTAPRSRRDVRTTRRRDAGRSRRSSQPCPTPTTGGTHGAGQTTISGCRSRSAAAAPRARGSPRHRVWSPRRTRSSAVRLPV